MQNKKQSIKIPVLDQLLLPSASASPAVMQSNVGSGFTLPGPPYSWTKIAKASFFTASYRGLGGPGLGTDTLSPPLSLLWAVISRFHSRKLFFTFRGTEEQLERGRRNSTTVESAEPGSGSGPELLCGSVFCASVCPFIWPWLRNLRFFNTDYI